MSKITRTGTSEIISRFIKDLKLGENLILEAFSEDLYQNVDNEDIKVLQTLIKQRILVPSFNGFRLNPHLQKLFNSVIDIDRSRYINVNIKARIPALELVIKAYITYLNEHNEEYAKESLIDIEQQVFEIIFEAQGAVKSLANRLQTKFGFVNSLKEKILENESAIETAGLLVENLTSFSFHNMVEYVHQANNDNNLYNLICVHLLGELAKVQASLNSIMIQLRNMLSVFRKQRRQTNLLKAFSEKHYKEPNFKPQDSYVLDNNIPTIFNRASSLKLETRADIHSDTTLKTLTEIVQAMKKNNKVESVVALIPKAEEFDSVPTIETENYTFTESEDDIVAYFREVINSDTPVSALNFLTKHNLNYKKDHWLFAIYAYYEDLSQDNKKYFNEPELKLGYMYDSEDLKANVDDLLNSNTQSESNSTKNYQNSKTTDTEDSLNIHRKINGFGNKVIFDFSLSTNFRKN